MFAERSFKSLKNRTRNLEIRRLHRENQKPQSDKEGYADWFENFQDGLAVISPQGVYLDCNPTFLKMLGYNSLDEINKQPYIGLVVPEYLGKDQNQRKLVVQRGASDEYPLEYFRKDGSHLAVIQRLWLGHDANGQPSNVFLSMRDNTNFRRLERELVEQSNALNMIVRVSWALRQAHSMGEMYQLVLKETAAAFNTSFASIILFEGDDLTCPAAMGQGEGYFKQLLQGPLIFTAHMGKRGQMVLISEGSDIPEGLPFISLSADSEQDLSVALVSIQVTESISGMICLAREPEKFFSPPEVRLLKILGQNAGYAVQRAAVLETLEKRVFERTRELRALYELALVANETGELHEMLNKALQVTLRSLQCQMGVIHLAEEEQEPLLLAAQMHLPENLAGCQEMLSLDKSAWDDVLQADQPVIFASIEESRVPFVLRSQPELGSLSYIGTPIKVKGERLGLLGVLRPAGALYSMEEVILILAVADQIGLGVEAARLREKAERSLVLAERERLARDLHDSVTQSLYSLVLFCSASQEAVSNNNLEQVNRYLERISETTIFALKEMRLMLYELRPGLLQDEGLLGALQHRLDMVEKRSGVEPHLIVMGTPVQLPMEIDTTVFQIAQEALNNALKHAHANQVTVQLDYAHGFELQVADNGCGFDPHNAVSSGGLGLKGMLERAASIDAKLSFLSTPGEGTIVLLKWELKNGNDPDFNSR
jgi:PAS domain S-box-containing protein